MSNERQKEKSFRKLMEFREANKGRRCSFPSCSEVRVGGARYCSKHRYRALHYGDAGATGPPGIAANARLIRHAERVWIKNQLHPAVIQAKDTLVAIIRHSRGEMKTAIPGWSLFARLQYNEVDRIFILWLGLVMFYKSTPLNGMASPQGLAYGMSRYLTRYLKVDSTRLPRSTWRGLSELLFRLFYDLLSRMADAYLWQKDGGLVKYDFSEAEEEKEGE